ncbi:MAG: MarR family transcriptional regulator, partial [Sulfolobus sp.]|nr:MarR family transcriptional regulator [Sulfolobus sp.]
MITLDDSELLALQYLITYISLSSYKFSKLTDIPSATAWRVFNRLAELGLVRKEEKGFRITPRGAVIAYIFIDKEHVRIQALKLLKNLWDYNGNEEGLRYFIEDLLKVLRKLNISPFMVCFNQPITLVPLLLNKVSEISDKTKEVIAMFLLKFFPTITLDGCKVILSFD